MKLSVLNTGLFFITVLAFLFAGCAAKEPPPQKIILQPPPDTIKDVRELPQENRFYLRNAYGGEKPVPAREYFLASAVQAGLTKKFKERFFAPWNRNTPASSQEHVSRAFSEYQRNPGFGENRRKRSPAYARALEAEANLSTYPNCLKKGVIVRNSSLRALPTMRPHYNDFSLPGEGWPFDNLQVSAIWAGTPVFISHKSEDGSWKHVESPFAMGWIPAGDVAAVDADFIRKWRSCPLTPIVEDDCAVLTGQGNFLLKSGIGAIFPKKGEAGDSSILLIPVSSPEGKAAIVEGRVKMSAAVGFLPATAENVARVGDGIVGQAYGWGGLYDNRDCSAMLRDIFACLGIWLPRHSADQAREGGRFVSLKDRQAEDKEKAIAETGIPFFTLLWLRGHIMLYIGTYEGKPLVFHDVWGIRTVTGGREGRFVIGAAAITTLEPGRELADFDGKKGNILERIEAMAIIGE